MSSKPQPGHLVQALYMKAALVETSFQILEIGILGLLSKALSMSFRFKLGGFSTQELCASTDFQAVVGCKESWRLYVIRGGVNCIDVQVAGLCRG